MTYLAPTSPSLRAPLSSAQIRAEFGKIATEFGLYPTLIGGSIRGFSGGQWNNPTLNNVVINGGVVGTVNAPAFAVFEYGAFNPSSLTSLGTGNVGLCRGTDGRLRLLDGSKIKLFTDNSHNLVMGDGVSELATASAGGFLYITTMNGSPTGVPTSYTGASAVMYDRSGNRLGVHETGFGWRYTSTYSFEALGTALYNPASLADGAGVTTTVTVTGATLGMFVAHCSFSLDLAGVLMFPYVSATNTVSVRFQNESGAPVDLGEGTITVVVRNG
jgi:hypothetical protein